MNGISTKIHIKNLPEIRYAFSQAPKLMNEEMKQALVKSGLALAHKSVELAPHKTGDLQRSHYLRGNGGVDIKGQGLKMSAEVGPTMDYSVFVHEGTRFMKARPFLKEATELVDHEVQGFFTDAVQTVFNKIGRMT